jgi:cell division protein FtsQ
VSYEPVAPIQQLTRALYWLAAALFAYGVGAWLLSLPVFGLHHVRLQTPVAHVTQAQVELVARRYVRGNFFTVHLERVKDAFEKLPWVREARVSRRWPDTLDVVLIEHVPLARWNEAALVNQGGEVFTAAYDADLPRFVGPDGTSYQVTAAYQRYRQQVARIGRDIRVLQLSPRRAWRMTLDDGTEITLGREAVDERLARFVAVYPKRFAAPNDPPAHVDLRYADGFAVRLKPSAARKSDS